MNPEQQQQQQPEPEYINDHEMARHLGVSLSTVKRWREERILPYSKFGGSVRYKMTDVDDFLRRNNRIADDLEREQTQTQEPDYISDAEVARRLSLNIRTVKRWRAERKLPFYKIGRTIRFKMTDVNEFLRIYNRISQ